MTRALLIALLLLGAPALAGSVEVGVQIYKIFEPSAVSLAADGGRPMELTLVAEDGRRRTLRARAAEISCGGRSPLGVRLGAKTLSAASLEARPARPAGLIRAKVPRAARARPYQGWFRISELAGRCLIVNRVDLEAYVEATACRELGQAPPEALRAQAVLVRTWALARRGRHPDAGADFCDLTHCQVYEGHAACDGSARAAMAAVRGKVLLHEGALTDVAYASTCGGYIARAADSRRASDGLSASRAEAATVPTSATVRVTVCSSRSKTARCRSRTPARKSPPKALPPTAEETTDSMSGRAASRSSALRSTRSSVTFSATSERTAGDWRATVARSANWSEFTATWRT